MPGPLNDADVAAALRAVAPEWWLERLDTRLGTAQVAALLKSLSGTCGGCGPCEDGPYSDGENREWWSRRYDAGPRGVRVTVAHETREPPSETVLREGNVSWNLLANQATLSELERRRDEQAQLPLFSR